MDQLLVLKERIEKLNKFHQIEIMKILNNHKEITINENTNGIFVNMSLIKKNVLEKIKDYLKYVNTLQEDFNDVETQKNLLTNKYFKDNKDNLSNKVVHEQA